MGFIIKNVKPILGLKGPIVDSSLLNSRSPSYVSIHNSTKTNKHSKTKQDKNMSFLGFGGRTNFWAYVSLSPPKIKYLGQTKPFSSSYFCNLFKYAYFVKIARKKSLLVKWIFFKIKNACIILGFS